MTTNPTVRPAATDEGVVETARRRTRMDHEHPHYKWIVLSNTTLGILQLVVSLVTFGAGSVWGLIDGILMLTGDPKDAQGRPLR